jgi:hypothetical protein
MRGEFLNASMGICEKQDQPKKAREKKRAVKEKMCPKHLITSSH